MFCDCEPCVIYNLSDDNYKKIDVEENIVSYSKQLAQHFLNIYKKKGNFFIKERITYDVHTDCFGLSTSLPLSIYDNNEKDLFLFDEIVSEGIDILENNGFHVNEPNFEFLDDIEEVLVQVHYTNAETEIVSSSVGLHKDNNIYSTVAGVNTLLVYVEADCIGGGVDIYDDTGNKKMLTIPPKSNDSSKIRCVLLKGECYYKPRHVITGQQIVIVFHYPKQSEYSSYDRKQD
jgi:hypothetical protein